MGKNIGFISTRFAGMDGVSLESSKWAQTLWEDGHVSYWYSGLGDRHEDVSMVVPEAFFGHPDNACISSQIWGKYTRSRDVTREIQELGLKLKESIYEFVDRYKIDVIVPQNILAIPMHLPLGVAVTHFLAETGMPAIAHHHDFFWERDRFMVSSVQDYIDMAFPPNLPNLRHVVINKAAQHQLGYRKGIPSLLIPNVFDFDTPPAQSDEYSKDLREELGFKPKDKIILQPTRIVPRKGIEHAIKLVGRLHDPSYKLVISHEAGDEGEEYKHMLEELAHEQEVDIRFISDRVSDLRRTGPDGKKTYTLWDLYPYADFVTYPSTYEGFGNALLESIYFKIPTLVNRYSIFTQDIEPKGFKLVVMDGIITNRIVEEVRHILEDKEYAAEITSHNYKIAKKYYSHSVLRRSLQILMNSLMVWSS